MSTDEQTDQMTVPSEPAVETATSSPPAEAPAAKKPAAKPRAARAKAAKAADPAPADAATPAAAPRRRRSRRPPRRPPAAVAPAAEKPAEAAAARRGLQARRRPGRAARRSAGSRRGRADARRRPAGRRGRRPPTRRPPTGPPATATASSSRAAASSRASSRASSSGRARARTAAGATSAQGGGGGGGEQVRDDRPSIPCTGILDVLPDGFGFLRTNGFTQGDRDVYVSLSQIRRFGLRRGDEILGQVREPKDNEKYNALLKIDGVNGIDPDAARKRPVFEQLTPLFPEERLRLETEEHDTAARIMDLLCPIGKGQRGLIVSPPKAGKTTILKKLANSIAVNNPEIDLFVLLVDERPEEVTDMQRSVIGTVVASTFDQPSENHVQVTELVLDRVKRLVEMGRDVVVLLDSITRMARAFNLNTPASGRILSGGVDSTALYPPKKFFGAARNIEEGGSLTILATALVDTGSRMDEVIFEEFKGTGNMEIRLDRKLADKRIFPAIDIEPTGTRKEELLMEPAEAAAVWKLRGVLHSLDPAAAIELLIKKMRETKNNAEFLSALLKNSR